MAHGDTREGKWRGNWHMEWVASTLTLPRNMVYPALLRLMRNTSAASSRLNWRPRRFKWTRPFRRKTKSGFCACAITFQTHSTYRLARQIWCISPIRHDNVRLHTAEAWIFTFNYYRQLHRTNKIHSLRDSLRAHARTHQTHTQTWKMQ